MITVRNHFDIRSVHETFPYPLPVCHQVRFQFVDRHAVNSPCTFVCQNSFQGLFHVDPIKNPLHQSFRC